MPDIPRSRADRAWAWVNLGAYLVMVTVNALANALPLFGVTTGAVSDALPNLFVPAGVTFSIWGLIYLLLGVFVVAGFVDAWRAPDATAGFATRIGPGFVVSSLANVSWILVWHARLIPASLLVMAVLLSSLIGVYRRLGIGRQPVTRLERLAVQLPFSVYLGWISVATIANVTAVLVWLEFRPVPVLSTVVMIAAAALLGLTMLWRHRDVAFALVVAWALAGIVLKLVVADESLVLPVALAATVGANVLVVGAVVAFIERSRSPGARPG